MSGFGPIGGFATGSPALVSTGGGGAITVSVPAAALTLTGFAPAVKTTGLVAVPVGTLTLTGFAPTVSASAGVVVQVPAAALTLTGFAPLVVTPRLVAVPAAALTLTGFAPSISTGGAATIQVPVGLLSLTGYAPTISVGGGPTAISIPSGTLTLTGWAPKVSNGAPKFAEKLDEYPQFPDASDQTMRKLTDLFRRTNQRVNRITEGVVYDHYAARQAQPASDEGAWGDFVLNSRPVELGSGGSKYIIRGWRRLQNDWVPERVLTGN